MVTWSTAFDSLDLEVLICPNRSLNWTGVKMFFLIILAFAIVVAGYFWLKGAWLVVPFTGLEMVVLGTALYLNVRCSAQCETIQVQGNDVVVKRVAKGWKKNIGSSATGSG